ncbi:hypothetical protein QUF64_10535 [Anaerolineales bacterium HSG6]|nr:hypothetical protein [Anaerolineales bacterium HSG6]MDM8529720.1 hypothetical protein [Anaerolineales bacterium HSG25]
MSQPTLLLDTDFETWLHDKEKVGRMMLKTARWFPVNMSAGNRRAGNRLFL